MPRRKTCESQLCEKLAAFAKVADAAHRAIVRNAKLSSRHTPAMRKAFRDGDKAGSELWARMNGHRSYQAMQIAIAEEKSRKLLRSR